SGADRGGHAAADRRCNAAGYRSPSGEFGAIQLGERCLQRIRGGAARIRDPTVLREHPELSRRRYRSPGASPASIKHGSRPQGGWVSIPPWTVATCLI